MSFGTPFVGSAATNGGVGGAREGPARGPSSTGGHHDNRCTRRSTTAPPPPSAHPQACGKDIITIIIIIIIIIVFTKEKSLISNMTNPLQMRLNILCGDLVQFL